MQRERKKDIKGEIEEQRERGRVREKEREKDREKDREIEREDSETWRALRVAKEKLTQPKKAGMHAKRYTTVLNMHYIRSIIHMYTY